MSPTPFGRRNFMKNGSGSSVFSMTCERFSTLRSGPTMVSASASGMARILWRNGAFSYPRKRCGGGVRSSVPTRSASGSDDQAGAAIPGTGTRSCFASTANGSSSGVPSTKMAT